MNEIKIFGNFRKKYIFSKNFVFIIMRRNCKKIKTICNIMRNSIKFKKMLNCWKFENNLFFSRNILFVKNDESYFRK